MTKYKWKFQLFRENGSSTYQHSWNPDKVVLRGNFMTFNVHIKQSFSENLCRLFFSKLFGYFYMFRYISRIVFTSTL